MARHTAAIGCVAALLAAGCGGSSGNSSTGAQPTGPSAWSATLTAGTHTPRVGAPWPITIRAAAGARPLPASVRYQFLFAGRPVASRSHYRFRGTFHDTLTWPASAVGIPITFRAIVRTPLGTKNLDYAVQVRR